MLQVSSMVNSEDALRGKEAAGEEEELALGGGVVVAAAATATAGRTTPSSLTFIGLALLFEP